MGLIICVILGLAYCLLCGYLSAYCLADVDSISRHFSEDTPPKDLAAYLKAPLDMSLDEASKLEDFRDRMEAAHTYSDIVELLFKRDEAMRTLSAQGHRVEVHCITVINVCFCSILFDMSTRPTCILLLFMAVSYFFFAHLQDKSLLKKYQRHETDWTCKQYKGEYFAPEVCGTVYQAHMSVRHHCELATSVLTTRKTSLEIYLFLTALFCIAGASVH